MSPVVVALLARTGARRAREVDGWYRLDPGIGLWLFSVLFLAMGTGASVIAIMPLIYPPKDAENVRYALAMAGISASLATLGWYGFSYIAFVRIRFNEHGVRRQFLWRETFVAWKDISRIRRHFFFGPKIVAKDGRQLGVWEYWRGFRDLIDTAAEKGIPIDFGDR